MFVRPAFALGNAARPLLVPVLNAYIAFLGLGGYSSPAPKANKTGEDQG
jgi:hypothetical protein